MALMAKLGPGKLDSHEVNNVYNISCCAILMLVSHVLQSLKTRSSSQQHILAIHIQLYLHSILAMTMFYSNFHFISQTCGSSNPYEHTLS